MRNPSNPNTLRFPATRLALLLLTVLSVSLSVHAQVQVLPFRLYSMQDGMISNAVSSVIEDSRGFLWIGTMDGLSMYDGARFTNFTMADGLPFSRVNCIIESRRNPGTLWVATNGGGISRFTDGKFTTFRIGTTSITNRVNTLLEDYSGAVWCGTDRGLFILRGDSVRSFRPEFDDAPISQLFETQDSLIVINAPYHPYLYSETKGTMYDLGMELPKGVLVVHTASDNEKRIWLCCKDSSIIQMANGHLGRRIRISGGNVYSLIEDREGEYWAGSDTGIIRISGLLSPSPTCITYSRSSGLPDTYMYTALCDREGDLWFFSLNNGLAKLSNRGTSRFAISIIADYGNGGNILKDRNGHVWVAAGQTLVECWQTPNGTWDRYSRVLKQNGVTYEVFSIQLDSAGFLWVRARPAAFLEYAVHFGKPSTLEFKRALKKGEDFPNSFPFNMVIDRQQRIWAGLEKGLFRIDLKPQSKPVLKSYSIADGLPDASIWTLYRDRENREWAGGYLGGVSVYDSAKDAFKHYSTEDGLSDNSVRAIFEDSRGRMWIGTRYGGVCLFEHGIFRTFNQKDGLLSNAVTSISEDERGNLWFGTVSGLQSMDGDNPTRFYSYPELTGHYFYSCAAAGNGFIAATAIDGIFFTDTRKDEPNRIPPPIYIASLHVNEKNVDWNGEPSFSYDQNNCLISFVGVSLRDGGALTYRYRLLPTDNTWHPEMRERSVAFAALRPGSYTFKVTAINSAGVESVEPAVITFTITSPFWLTWWFVVFVLMLIGAAIITAVRLRERQIIALERVRSRIASDLHDDVGSGLIRIALLAEVIHRQASAQNVVVPPLAGGKSGASFDVSTASRNVGLIARELVDSMNDVVWSIDPRNDSLERFLQRIETFATELCDARGIALSFEGPHNVAELKLGTQVLRCMLLVSKEALANCIRHSKATAVRFCVSYDSAARSVVMSVTDNGCGFEPDKLSRVNGLENMRQRAEKVQAAFSVESSPNHGTTLTMTVKP